VRRQVRKKLLTHGQDIMPAIIGREPCRRFGDKLARHENA